MFPIIKLKETDFDITAQPIIKAADYQQLVEAELKADAILQNAEQVFEEEKARGYQEGLAQARAKEVELALANTARIIRSYEEAEQSLTDLVISSVRKILHEFSKEELAYQVVRKALYKLGQGAQVTVRIPQDVAEPVRTKIKDSLMFYPGLEKFEVVEDPVLEEGDCRIESNFGVISASVEEQITALTAAMNGQLTSERSSRSKA
ncbi:MAG: HrpE/YscL family type III secretion apparatus protein [Reinekea sp.]|jgi:type III secretion protein L